MKLSRQKLIVVAVAGAVLIIAGVVYVAWYTYHRRAALAQIAECNYELAHPAPPTLIPGPGGMMVSATLAKMCPMVVVPPALGDLIRGHIVFSDLSQTTKVNPYSLVDILLGRYTLGPNNNMPCNQSATTTDCRTLPLAQPAPQPYVPPSVLQLADEWATATDTLVSFADFTFTLPPGWYGKAYKGGYDDGWHALVQKSPNELGFTINCPPYGKGFEAATRLSNEERSFVVGSTTYSVAFEQWTEPSRGPWFFVWLRASVLGDRMTDAPETICLAQGSTAPNIAEALRALYESWK